MDCLAILFRHPQMFPDTVLGSIIVNDLSLLFGTFLKIGLVSVYYMLECHIGNHCSIPNGLQIHMLAGLAALQLNHYQSTLGVQSQQVDPSV